MTAPDLEVSSESATRRPAAHFTPRQHWLNDPNGLIFHGGLWHIYYQHNPYGVDWGNMSWGHATSSDLLNWTEHAVAIEGDGDHAIFSGSVVYDAAHSSGLGDVPPLVAFYTAAREGHQAQAAAWSTDGGYSWTKHGVVLDRQSSDFRDPKVFRHRDRWIMVAVEAHDRQVHIFGSTDLLSWEPLSVFGPAGATGGIWECPDLFELDGRWVLVVSMNPGGPAGGSAMQYFVGDFDGRVFTAETNGWLDWGRDFYAGVTFNDAPDGRRVMLAWMSNWDYAGTFPSHPWRGSFTLPRELSLTASGQLTQSIPLASALAPDDSTAATLSAGGSVPVGRDLICLAISGGSSANESFALSLGSPADESDSILISVENSILTVDRTRASGADFDPSFGSVSTVSLANERTWELQVWLDSMSVEVLAESGTVSMTEQIPAGRSARIARLKSGRGLVTSLSVARLIATDEPAP